MVSPSDTLLFAVLLSRSLSCAAVAQMTNTTTGNWTKEGKTGGDGAYFSSSGSTISKLLDPSRSHLFGATVMVSRYEDEDEMETIQNWDTSAAEAAAEALTATSSRIVGGSKASMTEAPFFTLLITLDEVGGVWKNRGCGGAVISNRHVITSAHCFYGRTGKTDAVFINAYDPFRGNPSVPYHFSKIESFTMHPLYDVNTKANDLAIITLRKPIKDSVSFPPVRILRPQDSMHEGQDTTIYGFGRKSEYETSPVEVLRSVTIPYISNEECRQYYPWKLRSDMICAGIPNLAEGEQARDSCNGDSGGPMTTIGEDGFVYQIGTVSWGEGGCGKSKKPGVYTSVQYHHAWITDIVCSDAGVDASIDLCSSLDLYALTAPTVRSAPGCANGKQLGSSCSYGGECCSGMCKSSTFYSRRVCQNDLTSVTVVQERDDGHRRLRSRPLNY